MTTTGAGVPAEPTIQRIEVNQLQCLRIQNSRAEVLLAEQGAQVLRYQEHGKEPIVWLSEEAAYETGHAVRGGVPVCWPWFGDLMRNPPQIQAMHTGGRLPAHGLVRDVVWSVENVVIEGDTVSLELVLPATSESPALRHLPEGLGLRLSVRLDKRLHLDLTTINGSNQPFPFSQALHSYFAVSAIPNATVEGLEGRTYIETLEGWATREQKRSLVITSETDRIYLDVPPQLSIHDAGWGRRIRLESRGSKSAVVWNPWVSKARRLSQFADDAWQRMLCIETANALEDMVELAPGEQHTIGVSLWADYFG